MPNSIKLSKIRILRNIIVIAALELCPWNSWTCDRVRIEIILSLIKLQNWIFSSLKIKKRHP
jgi:hypothetical protein